MSKEEKSAVVFSLKNNDLRNHGFAAGLCVAGTGCPTPPAAAALGFSFPRSYELSEEQMFRSYRGVVAAMRTTTLQGKPAIQVKIPGVPNLTADDIENWAKGFRKAKGWKEPESHHEHGRDAERAMNRPEDPIEKGLRAAQEDRDVRLVSLVLTALEEREKIKAEAAAQAQGQAAKK